MNKRLLDGTFIGSTTAPIVIEFFWDYCCPFSAKSFKMIYNQVFPMAESCYPGEFKFVFRHQVQPWHPQSAMLHEAGIAVRMIEPSLFFNYSQLLFEHQYEFFDDATYYLSRSQIYSNLVDLAKEIGIDGDKMTTLLAYKDIPESHNSGNEVTDALKVFIRFGRRQGIHTSPTVVINGLEDVSVQSSWDLETWKIHLSKLL
jgi:protein-disulfide isomerase